MVMDNAYGQIYVIVMQDFKDLIVKIRHNQIAVI